MHPMDARPVPVWERVLLVPMWCAVALGCTALLARDGARAASHRLRRAREAAWWPDPRPRERSDTVAERR